MDSQHHSVEVAQVLGSLRRRFNFASIPTLLLGGIGEIEEFCCAVSLACGCHWAGEVRPVNVYTSKTSNQFTFQCRRLLCMVPTGRYVCRLPPTFNIADCPTVTDGWCTVVVLMRHLCHAEPLETGGDVVYWLYVVSDDPGVPALLSQHIEPKPSILCCSLKCRDAIRVHGDGVADGMRLGQEQPPLHWDVFIERWSSMSPLFKRDVVTLSVGSSESDSSVHDNPTSPKAICKPPAKVPGPKR